MQSNLHFSANSNGKFSDSYASGTTSFTDPVNKKTSVPEPADSRHNKT
jgi:hypothetical protein